MLKRPIKLKTSKIPTWKGDVNIKIPPTSDDIIVIITLGRENVKFFKGLVPDKSNILQWEVKHLVVYILY